MALLRSAGVDPLASASEQSLVTPLRDLVNTVLTPVRSNTGLTSGRP